MKTTKQWEHLKNMGKLGTKVMPEDVVFISLRDREGRKNPDRETRHEGDHHFRYAVQAPKMSAPNAALPERQQSDVQSFVDSLDASISPVHR